MSINLQNLPPPRVIESVNYAEILADLQAYFVAKNPIYTSIVEGDPGYTLLEAIAYSAALLYGRINDAAKAVLVTHAAGSDLDTLAAAFAITRHTGETDTALRRRVINQLETIALGSEAWYHKHMLAASPQIQDARVYRKPDPNDPTQDIAGEVVVYVQRTPTPDADTHIPEPALLQVIRNYLHAVGYNYNGDTQAAIAAQKRRFLCDTVTVAPITLEPYVVTAEITVLDGLDKTVVLQDVQSKIKAFATDNAQIGQKIPLSRIYATLDTDAVLEVGITWPSADVVPLKTQVPVAIGEERLSVGTFKTFNWTTFRNATDIAWSVGTHAGKGYLLFSNRFEQVIAIDVESGGTDYSTGTTVTLSGGGGSGATATPTIDGGGITDIAVTAGGTGFTAAPDVTITDTHGINAVATARISTDLAKLEHVRTCRRFQVFSLNNAGDLQNPLHIYRVTGALKKEPASGNTFHYYFELDDTAPPVTGLVNGTDYGIKILDSLEITAEGL